MAGISIIGNIRRMMAVALSVLLTSCIAAGCGGVNLEELPSDDMGDTFEYAYMLYVEEIILPDVVYEDANVYFQLRVSADANPSALKYVSFENWSRATPTYRLYGIPQERWMIDAFVYSEADSLEVPTDILPVALPSMPVGEWICVIRGAADRSLGGKRYIYKRGDSSMGPVTPPEEMQEIRFTVHVEPVPEE